MNSPERLPLTLPEGLADAGKLVYGALADALAPDPELLVSDWADQNRKLSTKASGEAGEWVTTRTPYLREIMNAMSPSHPATDGCFMKGTQIGGSEALYNAIGYMVDKVPCPIMLVMPTVDGAKTISKQRLQPMFDATSILSEKIGEKKSRAGGNTLLDKDFAGGILKLTGANSGPGLRNMPIRVLFMDEVDAYPDDVDGEGDPCVLAEKRTDQFGARAKRFTCSSPKIKGTSRIDARYRRGTRGKYYVPCPHCSHEQVLRWDQMRWEMEQKRELICAECSTVTELHDQAPQACGHCNAAVTPEHIHAQPTDDVAAAWYECEACQARIDEHYKMQMLERGRWVHEQPGIGEVLEDSDTSAHAIWAWVSGKIRRYLPRYRRPLSWHLPALYSPLGWFSWARAVKQRIDADKGGVNENGESLLQVFYNTVLGEPFEIAGEQPQEALLKLRADPYELGQVPAGGLLLTSFVDVQGDRLECKVKAYGRGRESWLIDYQRIYYPVGSKAPTADTWEQLIALRDKGYPHAGGQKLRIAAMGIDSGYLTNEVYDFCRKWSHKRVIATKGLSQRGKSIMGRPSMIDINYKGKTIKSGVQLWPIGADTGKELVYTRLAIDKPGPGYMHFPRNLPDEYYEGLTAEKVVRRRIKNVDVNEWVKTRERNEPLDLEVGCEAVAIYIGVQRINWDHLEQLINPMQRDIFAAPPPVLEPGATETPPDQPQTEPPATPPATVPPRRTGRVVRPPRSSWVQSFRN